MKLAAAKAAVGFFDWLAQTPLCRIDWQWSHICWSWADYWWSKQHNLEAEMV